MIPSQVTPEVAYAELYGRIEEGNASSVGERVVLSNLESCSAVSEAEEVLAIRFLARGRESYRIGRRGFHLEEAQVVVASQTGGAEVEIPTGERPVGLCVFVSGEFDWPCGPMIFESGGIAVGRLMQDYTKALLKPAKGKPQISATLVHSLKEAVPELARSVIGQAAEIDAAKPSTRFEMVRRANLAKAYLHSVTDRRVTIDEVARTVGTSQFHLLRAFQACFDETPTQYHRRLRLKLAMDAADSGRIALGSAAQAFGFTDGSSFSHAYRRAFGRAPLWTKRAKS